MGWMQKCAQTYENNRQMIGVAMEGMATLTPPNYMSQNAKIEIVLYKDGRLAEVRKIPKEQKATIVPVTAKSAIRTNGTEPHPHPLCEQLSYIIFGNPDVANQIQFIMDSDAKKDKKFRDENGNPDPNKYQEYHLKKCQQKHKAYIALLEGWAASEQTHFIVNAVCNYVKNGSVLQDLLNGGVIKRGDNGLAQVENSDREALVRWIVLNNEETSESWRNSKLAECWSNYLATMETDFEMDYCYVSGEYTRITTDFPKGISKRGNQSNAKLLSANEENVTGFTYKGRFNNAKEALRIGKNVCEKAHAALSWLVANQGKYYSGQTFVCWNPGGKKGRYIDDFDADLYGDVPEGEDTFAYTESAYAERLQKAISGERQKLDDNDEILILGMEAATTGRMAITYYNQLSGSDYLDRLESWQRSCAWYFPFHKGYVRSPGIKEIITFAFGHEQNKAVAVDDALIKEHAQKILHCILDEARLPTDLVRAITGRASMRAAYKEEHGYSQNYEKLLAIACALIRKYRNDSAKAGTNIQGKEEWTMELDTTLTDRSYLFGRLLAVAEKVERSAYRQDEKDREPAACRLQAAFAAHPMQTWANLEKSLRPYYGKLKPGSRSYYMSLVDEIIHQFEGNDLTKNAPLQDTYLLGYHLQRRELNRYTKNDNTENLEGNENGNLEEN